MLHSEFQLSSQPSQKWPNRVSTECSPIQHSLGGVASPHAKMSSARIIPELYVRQTLESDLPRCQVYYSFGVMLCDLESTSFFLYRIRLYIDPLSRLLIWSSWSCCTVPSWQSCWKCTWFSTPSSSSSYFPMNTFSSSFISKLWYITQFSRCPYNLKKSYCLNYLKLITWIFWGSSVYSQVYVTFRHIDIYTHEFTFNFFFIIKVVMLDYLNYKFNHKILEKKKRNKTSNMKPLTYIFYKFES